MFSYIFEPPRQKGGGLPQLSLLRLAGAFSLGGVEIVPIPLFHGVLPVLGFRDRLVRLPDRLQPHSRRVVRLLDGVRTLIIDALRAASALDPFQRGRGDRRRPRGSAPSARYFTHISPRSRPRRDVRVAAGRR